MLLHQSDGLRIEKRDVDWPRQRDPCPDGEEGIFQMRHRIVDSILVGASGSGRSVEADAGLRERT